MNPGRLGKGTGQAQTRENWHQERISPEFGQELLLTVLVPPPLAGAHVLVTPIDFIVTLSTLTFSMGVIVYNLNVQLTIIPFNWESILTIVEKYLTRLKR